VCQYAGVDEENTTRNPMISSASLASALSRAALRHTPGMSCQPPPRAQAKHPAGQSDHFQIEAVA
jgi:hypothetical protein